MCVEVGFFEGVCVCVWGGIVIVFAEELEQGKAEEFASHTHLDFSCTWMQFREEAEACLGT